MIVKSAVLSEHEGTTTIKIEIKHLEMKQISALNYPLRSWLAIEYIT